MKNSQGGAPFDQYTLRKCMLLDLERFGNGSFAHLPLIYLAVMERNTYEIRTIISLLIQSLTVELLNLICNSVVLIRKY